MRMIALLIALAATSGTAKAFDCAGVTYPPSVVLCSDPELGRLADERQEAINAARARIGEQAWPALWEDQKRWVRSYSTACGVPPDRPPPDPIPASVIACFKRAGEARVAYLRAYGIGDEGAAAPRTAALGPSFDCGKANSALAQLICGDPELSRLDLAFNQAYWALYQQLGSSGQAQLKQQDQEFIAEVEDRCGLSTSPPATAAPSQARDCVLNAYQNMRNAWLSQLAGPALEEASRALDAHLRLQRDLQQLGYLDAAAAIDGVYGRDTRAAIMAWQSARGRPVSGFLGDADAAALEAEARAAPAPMSAASAQTAEVTDVALKNAAGTYVVPVRINGVFSLDFIVDSGASDVLLPADVVLTLVRTKTITADDFIGDSEYALADGSTLKSARFVLRQLQVGALTIDHVTASIGSVNSQPLLGDSFLSRFASWSIDNSRHVLRLTSATP
jgi:clan AA aspartic protease (TIGR02281 family)